MRILHIITGLERGGTETFLYRLLRGLTKENFLSAVVSLQDRGKIGPQIEGMGIAVFALRMNPSFPNPLEWRRLNGIVRHFQPDLIQGWMYHGNLVAQALGVRWKIPVVWNIRQALADFAREKRSTSFIIRLGAKFSKMPRAILYNAYASAKDHEKIGYEPAKTRVIPNGYEVENFQPSEEAYHSFRRELGLTSDQKLVGLMARYHPVKDHETFLKGASYLSQQDVHFILAGKGVDEKNRALTRIIEELRLQTVHLLGEREDMPRITAALDIATSCSRSEAFSNSIGEAMLSGVPCVVTDVGDMALLVGDTGVIIEPHHPEALAKALSQILSLSFRERKALGEKARKKILENYNMDTIVEQYKNFYTGLPRGEK